MCIAYQSFRQTIMKITKIYSVSFLLYKFIFNKSRHADPKNNPRLLWVCVGNKANHPILIFVFMSFDFIKFIAVHIGIEWEIWLEHTLWVCVCVRAYVTYIWSFKFLLLESVVYGALHCCLIEGNVYLDIYRNNSSAATICAMCVHIVHLWVCGAVRACAQPIVNSK